MTGRCDGCGQPKRLGQLTLAFTGGRRNVDPAKAHCHYSGAAPDEVTDTKFALLCGPCLADCLVPEAAA